LKLTEILNKPKIKQQAKEGIVDDGKSEFKKGHWSLPTHIVVFLANFVDKNDIKLKLQPWGDFKNLLFDIYDHRIQHAPEMNGAINNTYISLDEHLVLYFLEKYKTRTNTQKQLTEFLASLKYYIDIWQRAKMFAQLLGFLHQDEKYSMKVRETGAIVPNYKLNDGLLDEAEIPYVDIYLQEFFLNSYAQLTKERKNFLESKEGNTYVR